MTRKKSRHKGHGTDRPWTPYSLVTFDCDRIEDILDRDKICEMNLVDLFRRLVGYSIVNNNRIKISTPWFLFFRYTGCRPFTTPTPNLGSVRPRSQLRVSRTYSPRVEEDRHCDEVPQYLGSEVTTRVYGIRPTGYDRGWGWGKLGVCG